MVLLLPLRLSLAIRAYPHSPTHSKTNTFCRRTFCRRTFCRRTFCHRDAFHRCIGVDYVTGRLFGLDLRR